MAGEGCPSWGVTPRGSCHILDQVKRFLHFRQSWLYSLHITGQVTTHTALTETAKLKAPLQYGSADCNGLTTSMISLGLLS